MVGLVGLAQCHVLLLGQSGETKRRDDSSAQQTDATEPAHENSMAMAPDEERGHLWWIRTKGQLTGTHTHDWRHLLLEAAEEGWTPRYSWPQIIAPMATFWLLLLFGCFLKALLSVQTVHERSTRSDSKGNARQGRPGFIWLYLPFVFYT